MADKEICLLCGKEKKVNKMTEYYIGKRTDTLKIMYKCKKCNEQIEEK